jgi:hypothetical protein
MMNTTITLAGTVKKIVDRSKVQQPQQAQISLQGADFLYDEIRVTNVHNWEVGKGIEVTLRAL